MELSEFIPPDPMVLSDFFLFEIPLGGISQFQTYESYKSCVELLIASMDPTHPKSSHFFGRTREARTFGMNSFFHEFKIHAPFGSAQ